MGPMWLRTSFASDPLCHTLRAPKPKPDTRGTLIGQILRSCKYSVGASSPQIHPGASAPGFWCRNKEKAAEISVGTQHGRIRRHDYGRRSPDRPVTAHRASLRPTGVGERCDDRGRPGLTAPHPPSHCPEDQSGRSGDHPMLAPPDRGTASRGGTTGGACRVFDVVAST